MKRSHVPRFVAAVAVALAAALAASGCEVSQQNSAAMLPAAGNRAMPAVNSSSATPTVKVTRTATATASPTPKVLRPASDKRKLRKKTRLVGPYSPKSVTASGFGTVIAANMMYRHTISVFSSDGTLRKTVSDAVDLSKFGVKGIKPGKYRGAPVESAFSPDGKIAWISNYAMYGKGFSAEGKDSCPGRNNLSRSFVYRMDVSSKSITGVVQVGKTPKFLAATPDGKYLLVSNWCSYDLSIVDVKSMKQVASLPMGPHPRGIAITKDSKTAYVAVMGGAGLRVVDIQKRTAGWIRGTGVAPRHVVLSPDEKWLYVSVNGTGQVIKIDRQRKVIVGKIRTGSQPRSLTIAPDGKSIYVVNYDSATMTKVRTSDMKLLQTMKTDTHPIGITYDSVTNSVWVSCYRGVIYIFTDR